MTDPQHLNALKGRLRELQVDEALDGDARAACRQASDAIDALEARAIRAETGSDVARGLHLDRFGSLSADWVSMLISESPEHPAYVGVKVAEACDTIIASWQRELLHAAGCMMNEGISRGLPLEWSANSGLGRIQHVLGFKTFADMVAAVRANADSPPAPAQLTHEAGG